MELKGLRVHPLFLAAGVLSAFTGQLFLFLAAVLAATEHELAHAWAAKRAGFALDKVVLMPYGAVISGDVRGIGKREELAVLAAGPLANGATGVFFIALWWLFPETYPFTELAAFVSLSLFFVNLLPAYPLDGGRMLRLLLEPLGARRAKVVSGCVSVAVAAGILGYFVWSCFSRPAFSALFFAAFLLAGAFGGGEYQRLSFSREKSFARGVEERRVAIYGDRPLKDAIRYLREESYLTLLLFDREGFLGELGEEEFLAALKRGDYSAPLLTALPEISDAKILA